VLHLIGRLIRYLVLAGLSATALAAIGLAAYTSTGRPDLLDISTDPVADDYNAGFHAYGVRIRFRNWEYPFGAIWHGRFELYLWYKLPHDATETQWSHSLGIARFNFTSSRQYTNGRIVNERSYADGSGSAEVSMESPSWLPGPLLGAYPFWVFLRGPVRQARRRARGLCVHCGYDLTGNVTGVCSECGEPTPLNPPLPRGEGATRSAGGSCSPGR